MTIKYGNTKTSIFHFANGTEVDEYHVVIQVEDTLLSFDKQLEALHNALHEVGKKYLNGGMAVFRRYYLSDAANQVALLEQRIEDDNSAVSLVQQPPLNGGKVALWAYVLTGVRISKSKSGLYLVEHGGYKHLWGCNAHAEGDGSELQTMLIFNQYVSCLQDEGCSLASNCIRTWFFVNDVDINYGGVVRARNNVFACHGLTTTSHYIASTGIGGRQANQNVLVQMDSYAVADISQKQIGYLYAPTHLNRTSEYGVSFERGTYVDYGDRRHVFISGTASINNKGEVAYPGNINKQTERMLENVRVLLEEANCSFADVGEMTVYLRDGADYAVVDSMLSERFPNTPYVIVLAPVCRPGWLIEMECMAVKQMENKGFQRF